MPPPRGPNESKWSFYYFLFFIGWLILLADLPFLVLWLGPVVKGTAPVFSLLLSWLMLAPLMLMSALVIMVYAWLSGDAVERRQARYTILITVALFLAYCLPGVVEFILGLIGVDLEPYGSSVSLAVYTIVLFCISLYIIYRVMKSFREES